MTKKMILKKRVANILVVQVAVVVRVAKHEI